MAALHCFLRPIFTKLKYSQVEMCVSQAAIQEQNGGDQGLHPTRAMAFLGNTMDEERVRKCNVVTKGCLN